MKKIFKNPYFYIAIFIGGILALPPLYLKITSRGLLADIVYRFRKVETPAITPDMAGYHPPKRGEFKAEDYVHFKLELLNALNHAVEGKEKYMENLIYMRFNITIPEIQKFRQEHRKEIEQALKKMPKWRKKIRLALKEAKQKGTKHPFKGDPL
ncbi:MAG: hypothetical protein D6767_05825 [Candidatus Hydrogenedentota bacterium]|nr:MAG: hypothetical protein D6767_05825 [Candidatus Hydrogenedentota bacterium]